MDGKRQYKRVGRVGWAPIEGTDGRRKGHVVLDVVMWQVAVLLALVDLNGGYRRLEPASTIGALVLSSAVLLGVGWRNGLVKGRWFYGGLEDMFSLAVAVSAASGAIAVLAVPSGDIAYLWAACRAAAIGASGMGALRVVHRLRTERRSEPARSSSSRVLIFGAGWGGSQAIMTMLQDPDAAYFPVAIIDDDPRFADVWVRGVPVVGTRADLANVARDYRADVLLVAAPTAPGDVVRQLVADAEAIGLDVRILAPLTEFFARPADSDQQQLTIDDIRPVTEADVLGRKQADLDIDAVAGYLTGRRVLVTGAGGSIGSELCRQVHAFNPAQLVLVDRDESALHAVQLSITGRAMLDTNDTVVCDIRDRDRVHEVFLEHRPEVVFHAAALKHLPLLELHPSEALKTNIWGTQNVLDAAAAAGVELLVNISTDKAADPTSVLGFSKRIGERLTAAATRNSDGTYLSVRFGNVLGSRGSVLTAFRSQAASGGPLTVTDPDVTRFFMTIEEAVKLVIEAGAIGGDGDVLVLDMGEPVRIADVARHFATTVDPPLEIVYTGLRPGEKLHEVLYGPDEEPLPSIHPAISHVRVPPLSPREVRCLDAETGESMKAAMERLARQLPDEREGADAPVLLSPPHTGEADRQALLRAFDSGWIAPAGPELDHFEAEFAERLGTDNAVALSSGTAALHLALRLVGVEAGDRVIVPTFTFAATANAVRYLGAVPVFVDSEPSTWNLDPDLVEAELRESARRGQLPKAVVAVDLYGQCADYDRLSAVCERYGIPIVEDAAEALGATYRGRQAGTLADVAAFSFNGNKIITTSGGGMLVARRREWADHARYLASQAREPVSHYEHRTVGYNYRMSNLLAALGRAQLRSLDERVATRRAHYQHYSSALADIPGVQLMPWASYGDPNGWLTCLTIDPTQNSASPDALREHLLAAGIETRLLWKPLHLQPAFDACPTRGGSVAETLFARGLCLPSGSSLSPRDRDRVVRALRSHLESPALVSAGRLD